MTTFLKFLNLLLAGKTQENGGLDNILRHMVFSSIIFLLIAIYAIYKTVDYLKKYFRILKKGIIADARVVSYTTYRNNMFLRNAPIPVFSFYTDAMQEVKGKPTHSFFIEIMAYQLNKNYKIKYDKANPMIFVVVNKIEVISAIVTLLLCSAYICWFTFFLSCP